MTPPPTAAPPTRTGRTPALPDDVDGQLADYIRGLAIALSALGLTTAYDSANLTARATNPAGHVSLTQEVAIRLDPTGNPCWFWLWQSPDVDVDYERICAADDVATAVTDLARVISLPDGSDVTSAG